ncbi:type II toxin-antitoxin system prevent-host-death family antitoxin [bacterium]|nr:type II toxin-antitoxin system prevent-host-death family antitoxin [bacterium]
MNHETYSTYEAKARLSELLRKVRAGQVVTLTHRGEPIVERAGVIVRLATHPATSPWPLESRLPPL